MGGIGSGRIATPGNRCPCHGVEWYVSPKSGHRRCRVKRNSRQRKYASTAKGRASHDRAHRRWYYEGGGRETMSIKALDERIDRYASELAEMGVDVNPSFE